MGKNSNQHAIGRQLIGHRCINWSASAVLALALLFAASNCADASDPRSVRFERISLEDGLSQSFVYAIAQDSKGYLWIGTQEGLNRFDGHDFTVFAHDSGDSKSISDETIRAMLVDRSGTLWLGTDAGGLSRYDAERQQFTNYLHVADDPSSIGSNRIRVIYEDRSGALWIGTDGAGLDRFDPVSETFTHFPPDPSAASSISGAHVWSILQRDDGSLWVATDGGLSRFDPGTSTFINYAHDPDDASSLSDSRLRVLYEDSEKSLWIGTEAGGLNRYKDETRSFDRFVYDPDDASSISANQVNTIFQDDQGVLWIGTVNGLNAWNPETSGFERYVNDPVDPHSLSHNNVLSLFQDRGGVIWIGTYDGLNKWNPIARAMLHYRNDPDDARSLNENTVTSFAEDRDGKLWVGTFGGGLNLLDPGTGRFEHIRHEADNDSSLSSDRVMALHVDDDGVLWAGTRNTGLNRFDRERGAFTRYRHDPENPASLSADGVTYILGDGHRGLWIGTFGGGLNHLDRDTGQFRNFRNVPGDPTTLSNDRVLVLFKDTRGTLWVGTYGGGLNRFDPATGTFSRFEADPDRPDSLSGNEIYMIQEDSRGNLWVGVKGGGLNLWRHADRQSGNAVFRRLSEMDGLPSASVYSGLWDESGHLWLSSARGLSRLDTESLEFRNYNVRHGLQGNEFNLAAGFRASDGRLFFGGLNGFNAFQPGELVTSRVPPQVDITRFLSLNSPIDLANAPRSARLIDLDHEQYSIGFEFAALDFSSPDTNRFEYKLEGLDQDWVDAGTNRQVTYTNLPAGEYSFKVRAANSLGVWSEQEAQLDFRMRPPPWRTWWAYLGYAIVLVAFAAPWIYARKSREAIKARYTENLRKVQAHLSEAQRIASIGNWHWNTATDEWWWSEQVYRLFRVKSEDLAPAQQSFLQYVHPLDRKLVERAMSRALSHQEPYSIDHKIVARDGAERTVHQRAEVALNDDGHPIGLAGTIHDITERKKAETEIKHHAEYHALLADISSRLIRARTDDIARQLRECLEVVGAEYALDLISVSWLDDNGKNMELRDQWVRPKSGMSSDFLDWAELAWIFRRLQAGTPIVLESLDTIPITAQADKDCLEQAGIRSFLAIPLLVDESLEGVAAFVTHNENRRWALETVEELKLVTENLGGAIARSRAMTEIRKLKNQLQEENLVLREEVRLAHGFDEIVGEHASLRSCLHAIEKVAPSDVAVLLLGETGTGKELFARAIHKLSARSAEPLVIVNCPTLPATLIDSELFGHERGAFTGAHSQRRGRFELAEGGTIFLDEIGELPIELQAKLLRVLQTGEFDRLGGTETLRANVRLIAATNRDLKQAVERGEFRADLYYRISSYPVHLPPLRERREDIPLLAEHFVRMHARKLDKKIEAISAKMIKELVSYAWPGNVRELESIIERAVISAPSCSVLELPGPLRLIANFTQSNGAATDDDLGLTSVERSHITNILKQTGWKVSGADGAASVLGLPESTLRSKMKRLGITRQQS